MHGAVAKFKVKSTRLMVVAVLGFVLCWGLTFWVELLYATVYGVRSVNNFALRIWCYLAQMSSSCLNPAIYAFFSPEFSKLVSNSVAAGIRDVVLPVVATVAM